MLKWINLPGCSRCLAHGGLRRPLLLARAVVGTFAKPADIGAPHKRNHVSLSWERQHLASPEGKKEANRSFPASRFWRPPCRMLCETPWLNGQDRRLLPPPRQSRSEEHTSELQSLMRISYAVFCLKKKKQDRRNSKGNK